jgi:hypothetical protein
MKASFVATITAVLGAGLVSGSVAQVAALDGNLERAARSPLPQTRPVSQEEDGASGDHRCRWRRDGEARLRAS